MSSDFGAGPLVGTFVSLIVQSALLVLLAGLISQLFFRRRPVFRHQIWMSCLLGLLLLPVVDQLRVGMDVPLLPWAASEVAHVEGTPSSAGVAVPDLGALDAGGLAAGGGAAGADEDRFGQLLRGGEASHTAGLVIALVWALGFSFRVARIGFRAASTGWLIRRSHAIDDPHWNDQARSIARELGLRQKVALRSSDLTEVPFATGVWRPKIVFPRTASAWSPARRRMVLLHEMAHLLRRDPLTLWMTELVDAIYWFHPAVHFAKAGLELAREQACDEVVMESGATPSEYARQLLDLAVVEVVLGVPAFARRNTVETRIRAVLTSPGRGAARKRTSRVVCGLFVVLVAAILFVHPTSASRVDPDVRPPDDPARDRAVAALESLQNREWSRVADAMRNESWEQTRERRFPRNFQGRDAIPALGTALESPSPSVRRIAAWALGETRDPAGTELLLPRLEDPSFRVRGQAAQSLGDIGPGTPTDALRSLLVDPNDWVRERAAHALGDIRDPDTRSDLIRALDDPSWTVRDKAAWALREVTR